MTPADTLFAEYASHHRDPRNRLCHEIGIPLIVLGLEALLRLIPIGLHSLATVVTLTVMAYYLWLARTRATVAIVLLAVFYFAAAYVPWPWAIAAFLTGWLLQFAGHALEGKSPAFLTNLVHLLVGPLWITTLLVPKRTP